MIFDKRDEKKVHYTFESQLNHKRYLDVLKHDFYKIYSNPKKYDKSVEDFDYIKVVGIGSFGTVFLVRDKTSLEYHAMKALEKAEVVKKKNVKQLYQERLILQCVKFPFLISLNFCCKDNLYIYLIVPFEAGGELFTLIKKMGNLSDPLSQFYAAQMVLALEYLHHCCIIHRDIKPENILISESGYIKLCDFGFGKQLKTTRTWTICGTPEYIAPEIILSKGYTYSVDWWSIGVLIYEMVSGYPPFYHSDTMSLYEKILSGIYKAPDVMTPACKSLLKHLLDVDPTRRYGSLKAGVYDIKNHIWFSEIHWNNILNQKVSPPFVPVVKALGESNINFDDADEVKLKKGHECLFVKEFEHF